MNANVISITNYLCSLMKNRNIYLFLTGLLLISFTIPSCKKEKLTSIPTLLTTGTWQLGSIQEYHYLGSQQTKLDTIDINSTQIFKFNKDMTCSYTNFDDKEGTVTGKWSLDKTSLYLFADITFPEVTSAGTKQPFINSHMTSLGEFSLVMETGDIQTYYNATDKRTIRRYGFVRIKPGN
jgi:hypothetical protein